MKCFLAFSFVFYAACGTLHAQLTFFKTYGGSTIDGAWSVQQTSDSGYVLTAETQSFGSGVYEIKTNINGNVAWSKAYSGGYGKNIKEVQGGGYITVGRYTNSFYLLRSGSAGNLLWAKQYTGGTDMEGYSIVQAAGGGYVMAGYTNVIGAGGNDIYLVRTDSSGNTLWTRTYGGSGSEGLAGWGNISIHKIQSGGYVIGGYTDSFGSGNFDVYIIRIDTSGNILWSKTFGGAGIDRGYGNSINTTFHNTIILAGFTSSFGAGSNDVYFLEVDLNENLLFSKTYGGPGDDVGSSVQETGDGGYIIGGYTNSFGAGDYDIYLLKTDNTGNLIWSKTFGGTGSDRCYDLKQSLDSGYILTGYENSFGAGSDDVFLLKTDASGNEGCHGNNAATVSGTPTTLVTSPSTLVSGGGSYAMVNATSSSGCTETTLCTNAGWPEKSEQNQTVSIFPDPFVTSAVFHAEMPFKNVSLVLFDVAGREIKRMEHLSGQDILLDRDGLQAGIYFFRIISGKEVICSGKL